MADQDDPILKALPPATDYITYLTILEYQLTKDRLPSLEKVLQDEDLTTNIGWDLIHLLLPLLPESNECLSLIANRGNPRENVIRISEELSKIAITSNDDEEEDADDGDDKAVASDEQQPLEQMTESLRKVATNDLDVKEAALSAAENEQLVVKNEPRDERPERTKSDRTTLVTSFVALLAMLGVVQPRIKTKYPSRFLATSLPAVLAAYRRIICQTTTSAVLKFLGSISGRQRPALPPRDSAGIVQQAQKETPRPDPEASTDTQRSSDEEEGLVLRLLQAALLETLEDYVLDVSSDGTDNGMAWEVRVRERSQPDRVIPGRKSETARYEEEDHLIERDSTVKSFFVRSPSFP